MSTASSPFRSFAKFPFSRLNCVRLVMVVAFSVVSMMMSQVTFGQTTTWTGASNTLFNNASNWTNGVPDSSKDAVFNLSGAGHIVVLDQDHFAKDVTISNGEFFFLGATTTRAFNVNDFYVTYAGSINNIDLNIATGLNITSSSSGVSGGFGIAGGSSVTSPVASVDGGTDLNIVDGTLSVQELYVGDFSTGSLWISGGGIANTISADFGALGSAIVEVSGIGSQLNSSGAVAIGGTASNATVTVDSGATMSSGNANIHTTDGSSTVRTTIKDAGSAWTVNGNMEIGSVSNLGTSDLSVTGGGTVNVSGTTFLHSAGSLTVNSGTYNGGTSFENQGDVFIQSGLIDLTGMAYTQSAGSTTIFGGTVKADSHNMNGGSFTIDGGRYEATTLTFSDLGTITGISGEIAGTVTNAAGAVLDAATASNTSFSNTFDASNLFINNHGTIHGTGRLIGALDNQTSGEIRVLAGDQMRFATTQAININSGRIDLVGTTTNFAELEFEGIAQNAPGGLITARNAILRFDRGLLNDGQLSTAVGNSEIYGDIFNSATGVLGVGGNSDMLILGDLAQDGTFNILSGSRGIVFGDFTGAGGTNGGGLLEVLGITSIGSSPGSVQFGGDLTVGGGALVEIGGLGVGDFDQMLVAGDLTLNGALTVAMWDNWTLGYGQEYLIADVNGILSGAFNGLGEGDLVGNFGGFDLFISYTAGNGNDVALFTNSVPEPGTLGLMVLGLCLISCRRKKFQ